MYTYIYIYIYTAPAETRARQGGRGLAPKRAWSGAAMSSYATKIYTPPPINVDSV